MSVSQPDEPGAASGAPKGPDGLIDSSDITAGPLDQQHVLERFVTKAAQYIGFFLSSSRYQLPQ